MREHKHNGVKTHTGWQALIQWQPYNSYLLQLFPQKLDFLLILILLGGILQRQRQAPVSSNACLQLTFTLAGDCSIPRPHAFFPTLAA